jgi:hypothetical protein
VALAAQSVEAPAQAPVRLFDRRKTREAARLNGYRRPIMVAGNGTTLTAKSLVDRFGRSLENGAESQVNDNGRGNGHAAHETSDGDDKRPAVAAADTTRSS